MKGDTGLVHMAAAEPAVGGAAGGRVRAGTPKPVPFGQGRSREESQTTMVILLRSREHNVKGKNVTVGSGFCLVTASLGQLAGLLPLRGSKQGNCLTRQVCGLKAGQNGHAQYA